MAFVHCDPRWKIGQENLVPGPGEYETIDKRVKSSLAKNRSALILKRNVPMTAPTK